MKAVFLNDEGAVPSVATPEQRKLIKPVAGARGIRWIYPKGTVVEGDLALQIVATGQGAPVDDECRKACGFDDSKLASLQVNYEMDSLGIHDPKHRELYEGGVMTGYDAKGKMVPGPNWEAYQAAIKELESEDEI